MSKIRIAFYKAQKGDFWGNMIAGYTSLFNWKTPKYCHVEIGLLDDNGGDPVWRWYSSASRNWDGTTGTRWIDEKRLLKHPERWDIYEISTSRKIDHIFKRCNEECGKPYDWQGILGFITPFGQLNLKRKWYCSEVCNYVFFGKWIKRISPKRFYARIKKETITCGQLQL